ncbi:hypothetical protein L0Y65_03730 [Candidatus Micrarchaeota archaeon]|nr:hypothetical protein [Candidatus Micrarchaeota archaeon]
MMLRTLFDERRRAEIRDALKSNKPIEFRGRPAAPERMAEFDLHLSAEYLARTLLGPRPDERERYIKGMSISDSDRMVSADIERYAEEKIEFIGRDDFAAAFSKVRDSKNPDDWKPFLCEIKKWAGETGEDADKRNAVMAAVILHYSRITGDYDRFWLGAGP